MNPQFEPTAAAQTIAPAKAAARIAAQAYQDYCHRCAQGERIDPDAYCQQFTTGRSQLIKLIQTHLFLEAHSSLLPSASVIEQSPLLPADLVPERWPEVGSDFLGFRLLDELGHGGFAKVFLAEEPKLGNRKVALKVAKPIWREAKILGPLKHANIVEVHSTQDDAENDLAAVCMPFVGRATFDDVLDKIHAQHKLPSQARFILDVLQEASVPGDILPHLPDPDRILQKGTYVDGIRFLGAQLADALAYIHNQGIYHRDLKPSNVLLSPAGVPMLLDFNLSAEAAAKRGNGGALGGTPTYMPPEQLKAFISKKPGDFAALDGQADIFSLGAILYELLTGQRPFGSVELKMPNPEVCNELLQRQERAPRPIGDLNPDIDPSFAKLVLRCLAYDKADRPQSAAELARLLREGLSPLPRTQRWLARHKLSATAVAGIFLAAVISAVYVTAQLPSAHERTVAAAALCYQEGKFAKAVEHYTKALQINPHDASSYFGRARAYQHLGKTERNNYRLAIDDYEQAQRLEPDGRNLACIGYCLNLLDDNVIDARGYYQRAIQAGFHTAEVANNLGYMLVRMEEYPGALESLDQAIGMNPGSQIAFYNRARAYWLGVVAKRKALQRRSQSNSKDEKTVVYFKKLADEIRDWTRQGVTDFEIALKLGPSSAQLEFEAACLYAQAVHLDPKWADLAMIHIVGALVQGIGPLQVEQDAAFDSVREHAPARFLALVAGPFPLIRPVPPVLIVDPIRDSVR